MMHVITGNYNDSVGQLIAGYYTRNTGYPITGPYSAMGWVKNGEIVGQAIFNDYTGSNLEVHIYGPGCINKTTIKDVYKYVFEIAKCERLTAKVFCTNEKLLQLLTRLGFVYEFTQKDYFKLSNVLIDAEVYKLTKENVPKWIKLNGQSEAATPD